MTGYQSSLKHDEAYYKARKPQPERKTLDSLKYFIWDPERKAILDRTAKEWAEVGGFYLCFYGVLFSIFALQMWISYKHATVYDGPFIKHRPRVNLGPVRMFRMTSANIHGPGIVLKPKIVPNTDPPQILIDENDDYGQSFRYVEAIDDILSDYDVDRSKFDQSCNGNKILRDSSANKSCYFDVTSLGDCSRPPYGYYKKRRPRPCIYVTFNKRFSWMPVFYSQASLLPDNMPKELQKVVKNTEKFHVWLSCAGKNEEDVESMGEIEYLPTPGFPVQFFPYGGQSDYLSPIVALRFKNITANVPVNIECKTWAYNIDNENRYNLNFQILIKS